MHSMKYLKENSEKDLLLDGINDDSSTDESPDSLIKIEFIKESELLLAKTNPDQTKKAGLQGTMNKLFGFNVLSGLSFTPALYLRIKTFDNYLSHNIIYKLN